MDIGIEILMDRRAALRFDEFPMQARDALKEVITRATERLRDMVREAAPERTGKLRSEIYSQVLEYPDRITGLVGVQGDSPNEFAKAAAEEYGAHGTTQVRSHAAKLDHLFGRHVAEMEVMVGEHSRKLNIKAQEYLRDPLRTVGPETLEEMRAVMDDLASAQSDS